MKVALLFFLTGICLLLLFFFKSKPWFSSSTVDIHLYDTYFVISYFSFAGFIVFLLGTFFSIGGIIGTHFHNKHFIFLALAFIAVDFFAILHYYKMFKA